MNTCAHTVGTCTCTCVHVGRALIIVLYPWLFSPQDLDEEALGKKPLPESVYAEAMNIIKMCREGSGEAIQVKARELQNRFDELSLSIAEQRELCEEATAAMQEFHGPYDRFCLWLSAEEEKAEEVRRTRKDKPLGNIQCELDEFFVSSGGETWGGGVEMAAMRY